MPTVEIYIGSLIEHASDRIVLEHLVEVLSRGEREAIILANVEIGGRQIDLVLALAGLTLVIEAKISANVLRGSANGPWEVRIASGGWKQTRNYYLQTREAALALRDAMSDFAKEPVGYPSAALVFAPSIPPGSEIPQTDFKVSTVGLHEIEAILAKPKTSDWPLVQWQRFATHFRLKKVQDITAAFDERLANAEDLIDRYLVSFRQFYSPLIAELIVFDSSLEGELVSSDQIADHGANGANLLLTGPSGCGKTLLGLQIALASIERGRVPILLRAQDFDGSLRDAVHREAVLLEAPSAEALVRAFRRLGRPISLIIDGYNECIEEERGRLTRSIGAATRRFEASIIITSQMAPERSELLDLLQVSVPPPNSAMKAAIACYAAGTDSLDPSLEPLVGAIESGLEARLIGETSREISSKASRFAIFDAFVRKKLDDDAQDGIRALAQMARLLIERVVFSLSVRDFDRLAEQAALPPNVLQRLIELKLLTKRSDRVSFAHELLLNAFAAEALIRQVGDNTDELLRALQSPLHAERQALIVGAIDDDALLMSLLPEIVSSKLVVACLTGQCGEVAHAWASDRCAKLLVQMRGEVEEVTFELSDDSHSFGVAIDDDSLTDWSPQDEPFFLAIGALGSDGLQLDTILENVAAMDHRLEQEFARLLATAREQNVALRSGLFMEAYVSSRSLAIGWVVQVLYHGRLRDTGGDALASLVSKTIARTNLSHGQLYVLLSLARHAHSEEALLAPLMPQLLRRYWPGAPYHLKLDLLWAAQMCGRTSDADRLAIINALQELPWPQHFALSGSLMDALKSLGGLVDDEAGHLQSVRSQIRHVLSDQDNPNAQAAACGVWSAQFDHPYEGAYWEAIAELSEKDSRDLLIMAAKGTADESPSFFTSILILELAAFADPTLGVIIARWTALPAVDSFLPQDAIKIFATAHIALGRLTCPLPNTSKANSAAQDAMSAVGNILYWLNRHDLPMSDREAASQESLTVLLRHETGVIAGVLRELERAFLSEGLHRLPGTEPVHVVIGNIFKGEVAEICRMALRFPKKQSGYFVHSSAMDSIDFAVTALGRWGNLADIGLLRKFSDHRVIGATALRSIRSLEQAMTV